AEVHLPGLAEALGLVTALARHGDDDLLTVQDDLGATDTDLVDPVLDDLACLVELVLVRGALLAARGQRDPGAALQLDTQLGLRLVVTRGEHERIQDDHDEQEGREVSHRPELPGGRWCHGWSISLNLAGMFAHVRAPAPLGAQVGAGAAYPERPKPSVIWVC